MSKPAIVVDSVWKSYRIYHQQSHSLKERILTRRHSFDEFWALKGVSFEVEAGSTLGIIGSNGSGKSTMLKVLARILTPNRGAVAIHGTMSSLLELGTGFHPELTGKENVFLAGSLMGQNEKAMRAKYDAIVDFAGIEQFMDLPVKNYSSGMYARLAFAVAISVDPEILVIDEVLSVGDEQFQMRCYERIAEFRAQGRTIVLVSHSLDSIRSLCSDALWLEKGNMRALGPSNDVVAEYLAEVHATSDIHQGTDVGGDRWGTGELDITRVAIEGRDGGPLLKTGEPMQINIGYQRNKADIADEDVVCGIAIYRAETLAHVYGTNTHRAGTSLQFDDQGTVTIDIAKLPILQGNYVLTVALHDKSGKLVYDWHERRYSFMVFDDPAMFSGAGLVHIDAVWSSDTQKSIVNSARG